MDYHINIKTYLAELIPDESSRKEILDLIASAVSGANLKKMIFLKSSDSSRHLYELIRYAFQEDVYDCSSEALTNKQVKFDNLPYHRIAMIDSIEGAYISNELLKRVTSGDLFIDEQTKTTKLLPQLFIGLCGESIIITDVDQDTFRRILIIETQIPSQYRDTSIMVLELRRYIRSYVPELLTIGSTSKKLFY